MISIRFVSKNEIAPNVWQFRFVPLETVECIPGQYSHLYLPSLPHERPRAFTWSSHPEDHELQFITRIDSCASLYKQTLLSLRPGDIPTIDEPMGDAILPRLVTTPLVFVAQGIAIASFAAILRECAKQHLPHQITLFWTRRQADDLLGDLIPKNLLKFERVDRIYPERLRVGDLLPSIDVHSLVYLTGSQSFVETLGTDLENGNIPRERIIFDYYDGYQNL